MPSATIHSRRASDRRLPDRVSRLSHREIGLRFSYTCSLLGSSGAPASCAAIGGDGNAGKYGELSFCSPAIKLSYAMSAYYMFNPVDSSCNFGGNATLSSTREWPLLTRAYLQAQTHRKTRPTLPRRVSLKSLRVVSSPPHRRLRCRAKAHRHLRHQVLRHQAAREAGSTLHWDQVHGLPV